MVGHHVLLKATSGPRHEKVGNHCSNLSLIVEGQDAPGHATF